MKRLFLMIVVSCFFVIHGLCQEAETAEVAEITFEKTEHDCGTLPLNGVAEYEFTFTNTGNIPLVVQDCRAGCSCTVPECPKGKPIEPGETGKIKVRYTTTHIPGSFNRTFTVVSNAKTTSVILRIKGEISREETATN